MNLLGELDNEPEHFVKAWEISKRHCAKAQRLLGYYYLKKGDFKAAIEPFNLSLKINHLYPTVWYSLGCCHLKSSEWEPAARAFTACVQQEPEDGEAWSNLSTAFQQLDKLYFFISSSPLFLSLLLSSIFLRFFDPSFVFFSSRFINPINLKGRKHSLRYRKD